MDMELARFCQFQGDLFRRPIQVEPIQDHLPVGLFEMGVPSGLAPSINGQFIRDKGLVATIGASISVNFPGNGASVPSRFFCDLKNRFSLGPQMADYVPLVFGDLPIIHGDLEVVVNPKVASRPVTLKYVALNSRKRVP